MDKEVQKARELFKQLESRGARGNGHFVVEKRNAEIIENLVSLKRIIEVSC